MVKHPVIEPPNPTAAALVEIAEAVATQRPIPQPAVEQVLIGKVPKSNGSQVADPRNALAQGLARFDDMMAERERLQRELRDAQLKISQLELQISEIEGTRNTIESRINACVLERDQAVREAGELRGVLNSVAAICVRYHDAQQQD